MSQERFQNETRLLREEIKTLQINISEIKKNVQLKEKELKEKISEVKHLSKKVKDLTELLDHEKDISNQTITKKEEANNEKSKKIIKIEKENEDLKTQNDKMSEMVNVLKSEFKCNRCTFDAETNTQVKNHRTGNQIVKKDKDTKNLQTSNIKDKKSSSCDKCDFTYINQFDLLIHKSAKHTSYILNSQPEALTGPLH